MHFCCIHIYVVGLLGDVCIGFEYLYCYTAKVGQIALFHSSCNSSCEACCSRRHMHRSRIMIPLAAGGRQPSNSYEDLPTHATKYCYLFRCMRVHPKSIPRCTCPQSAQKLDDDHILYSRAPNVLRATELDRIGGQRIVNNTNVRTVKTCVRPRR